MRHIIVRAILTLCITAAMTCTAFTAPMPAAADAVSGLETPGVPGADDEPGEGPEASGQKGGVKEGWEKGKEKDYYYQGGEKLTGWQEIEGRYYYFNKKGVLQKNKIAGDKKGGYFYVGTDGVRITDETVQAAVKFVGENSNPKDTKKKRLKSCYNALAGYRYQRAGSEKPSAGKMKLYAAEMFENKKGDCYRFAAALAYIARVLGYDSRTSFDNTVTLHGWTEIKINGQWATCDCSMRRVDKKNNFFLVNKETYAALVKIKWGADVRWDSSYTMYAKNGKIRWK